MDKENMDNSEIKKFQKKLTLTEDILEIFIQFIYPYFLLIQHVSPLVAQLVKNLPAVQETPVQFLDYEDSLEKGQATHSVFLGFPGGSDDKESAFNVGDLGTIPGLIRSSGGGHGNPLQSSCLENPVDRGTWGAMVHNVADRKSTRLNSSHAT